MVSFYLKLNNVKSESMRKIWFVIPLMFLLFSLSTVNAQSHFCVVYFTGVGCPHCAKTDPVVLIQFLKDYPNIVLIEYEIYKQRDNAPLLYDYKSTYNSGMGVPLLIFGKNDYIIGDSPILQNARNRIQQTENNPCPLINGTVDFDKLDFNSLPGVPKVWSKNRILIAPEKRTERIDNNLARKLLTTDNLSDLLLKNNFEKVNPQDVALSGRYVKFSNAIRINGWTFQWNEENQSNPVTSKVTGLHSMQKNFSWLYIFSGIVVAIVLVVISVKLRTSKSVCK